METACRASKSVIAVAVLGTLVLSGLPGHGVSDSGVVDVYAGMKKQHGGR